MGLLGNVKRFGTKLASGLENTARFGQKALNAGARLGNKVANTIDSVASGVASVPVLGAISNMPIPIVNRSAQDIAKMGSAGLKTASAAASAGADILGQGANLVRTGRGIMEAGNPVVAAQDMLRQGRSIANASKALGQQIQRNM